MRGVYGKDRRKVVAWFDVLTKSSVCKGFKKVSKKTFLISLTKLNKYNTE